MRILEAIDSPLSIPEGAWKELLRWAGFAGPWTSRPTGLTLGASEDSHATAIAIDVDPSSVLARCRWRAVKGHATCVLKVPAIDDRPLIMPVWDRHALIERTNGLDIDSVVLRHRKGKGDIGFWGHCDGSPYLALGFRLSEWLKTIGPVRGWYGYGQLAYLLRWFLREAAGCPVLFVNPWQWGRTPLLLSFDMESRALLRSKGSTVFRIRGGARDLLNVSTLKLRVPLRGRRVRVNINRYREAIGEFASLRITMDWRPESTGTYCDRPWVRQVQVDFCVPSRRVVKGRTYGGITKRLAHRFGKCSFFFCPPDNDSSSDRYECGFHGWSHEHFTEMSRRAIERALVRARQALLRDDAMPAARAPGLLWSAQYFDALAAARFGIDSSFREVNPFQPILPWRHACGWWEVPVTGCYRNLPDPAKLVRAATGTGGMVSVYAHDHDLATASDVEALAEWLGFAERSASTWRATLKELVSWLDEWRAHVVVKREGGSVLVVTGVTGTVWEVHSKGTKVIAHCEQQDSTPIAIIDGNQGMFVENGSVRVVLRELQN